MNSKHVFLSIVALPLFLAGCSTTSAPSVTPTPSPTEIEETTANQLETILASGGSARCTMSKTDGTSEITYSIKGKKMRMEGAPGATTQNNGSVISDGSYLYIWENGKTEGIKSKIPTEQEMEKLKEKSEAYMQNSPNLSDDAVRKEYEDQGYRIDCKGAQIPDSEFVPPTTIKFTDTTALMENAAKMMEESSKDLTPEQKAQMQKYLNPSNLEQ